MNDLKWFCVCSGLLLFLLIQGVFAYTGCPGDLTNTTVVAEYIFHEGAGSTTYNTGTGDGSGDATLTNGVAFSTDVPPANTNCGYSASIPSTGSGATTPALETAPNYDPLAGATNFTIMTWVKRQSASTASNQSARIVSDTSSTSLTNTTAGFEFRFSGSAGTLAVRINGVEVSTSVGGIAPNDGNWHHVAVVYDGTQPATNTLTRNVHFYIDGVQRGDGNTLTNATVAANTNRLTLGNSAVSRSVNNLLVGNLDDVRMLRSFAPSAVGDGKTNDVIRCYMNSKDDFEPPTITCPASVAVGTDPGECFASGVALGTPIISENCGAVTLTNNAPMAFPLGVRIVTWAAVDANGNSNTCQQMVTVTDTEPPNIICPPDITVVGDSGESYASNVELGQPTVSDYCGVTSVTNNASAHIPVGTNAVTWTATDAAGNSATCQQMVTVVDYAVAYPTATVSGDATICAGQSATIQTALTGSAPWILRWSDGMITTNWTSPCIRSVSPSSTTTYTVTGLTGAGYNGTSSGSATVTVNEPALIAGQPEGETVYAGASATFSATATGTGPLSYQWRKATWVGGAWVLHPGSGSLFIGFSTDNDVGDPASNDNQDINTGGRAWAVYNGGGAVSEAIRTFSAPLAVGETFGIDIDNGNNNGVIGLSLQDASGQNRLEFHHRGTSGGGYKIAVDGNEQDLGIPFTRAGLHVELLVTDINSYVVTITRYIDGSVYGPFTGTFGSGSAITRLRVFSAGAGDCGFGCNDFITYFNNFRVGAESDSAADAVYANGWPSGANGGSAFVALVGATESSLTISSTMSADAGIYKAVVNGICGDAATTSVASLLVIPVPDATIAVSNSVCPTFAGNRASVANAVPGAIYAWTLTNGLIEAGQTSRTLAWIAGASGVAHLGVTVTTIDGRTATGSRDVSLQCAPDATGLRGDYYNGQGFQVLRLSRIDSQVNFDWGRGSPDSLVGVDSFSVRWTGQLTAQFSETYTFTTVSDDGVRLYLDNQLLIDNWTDHTLSTNSASIALMAGRTYNIRMEYYDDMYEAVAKLFWTSASQPFQPVQFSLPPRVDSDGDGIFDDDETNVYHTDPNKADTEGAGISDSEELFQAFTDPRATNFDGTVMDVVVKNGSETNNALGRWQVEGIEIYAIDRRGYVEYQVLLPSANVYRLVVTGREQIGVSYRPSQFDLQTYVDGEYLGRQTLTATSASYGAVHYYTLSAVSKSRTRLS
jgi:hypothetical protein